MAALPGHGQERAVVENRFAEFKGTPEIAEEIEHQLYKIDGLPIPFDQVRDS